MQFGLQINPYSAGPTGNPWDAVERVARAVDQTSFDSLWLYDHFLYEGGYSGHPVSEPVLECFTTLGAVAAITRRVRLGQLVLGVPYRNPAMTVKMATTLDLISGGRSILGLGAGWHQREYEAYGWGDFEPPPVRLKRLEEALQVARALWTERPADFAGTYYRLDNVMENPAPVQKPHPPIMVGGSGEKVTLRLVAQYADACNLFAYGGPDVIRQKLDVLRGHCEDVGRDYEEIERTALSTVNLAPDGMTAEEVIGMCRTLNEAGIDHLILNMPNVHEIRPLETFGEEIIPSVAGL